MSQSVIIHLTSAVCVVSSTSHMMQSQQSQSGVGTNFCITGQLKAATH